MTPNLNFLTVTCCPKTIRRQRKWRDRQPRTRSWMV